MAIVSKEKKLSVSSDRLTKKETVALWHCVANFEVMIREMKKMSGITQDQVDAEKEQLRLARIGLRKVNKLRGKGL